MCYANGASGNGSQVSLLYPSQQAQGLVFAACHCNPTESEGFAFQKKVDYLFSMCYAALTRLNWATSVVAAGSHQSFATNPAVRNRTALHKAASYSTVCLYVAINNFVVSVPFIQCTCT